MDPDAALSEMLDLAKDLVESGHDDETRRLCELMLGLDHWLIGVGYLPERWAMGRA